jgi:putative flippase GtrA
MISVARRESGGGPPETDELSRFALVGAIGFLVDLAVLHAATDWLGLYLGRIFSFLAAATATWYLNARFTFRVERLDVAQWARFLGANSGGAVVNYSIYAGLIAWGGLARRYPAIGVGCGSLAGLAVNFLASRRFVFVRRT